MSSSVTADLQCIDRAIRSGVSHRALLKSGSIEAWNACLGSLEGAIVFLMDPSFSNRIGSSAATWIRWRKSSTSKLLLGLLRTAIEEAPGAALAAGCVRERALHVGFNVIRFLFRHTQSGALWPAMREWIVEQGGLRAIWQALAWSMALVGEDQSAHDVALRLPVQKIIGLMLRPDGVQSAFPLPAHPCVSVALTLLFRDLLPRDLASGGNAHSEWGVQTVLGNVVGICNELHLGGSTPLPQLHRAFIVSWPHLMGWFRHRPGMQRGWDVENLMVRH